MQNFASHLAKYPKIFFAKFFFNVDAVLHDGVLDGDDETGAGALLVIAHLPGLGEVGLTDVQPNLNDGVARRVIKLLGRLFDLAPGTKLGQSAHLVLAGFFSNAITSATALGALGGAAARS